MSPVPRAAAALTTAESALRTAYLTEVMSVLYPPPCEPAVSTVDSPAVAEFVVVPNLRRPRLLVPRRSRRVAAAALRRYAQPPSRLARVKRGLAVLALRTGASTILLPDRIRVTHTGPGRSVDTIERYLRQVLGHDILLSVHIGPARANRKPVLQLLSPDADTIGFAKLGSNPLTRTLVRQETYALTTLAQMSLRHLVAPRVLHAGQWREHEVLVQEALPGWRPRVAVPAQRLASAMREVAWCLGVTSAALGVSNYWRGLRDRLSALTGDPQLHRFRAETRTLGQAADELVARAGDTELRYGAWHGDWAPWNMAALSHHLLVWDWERFGRGVPVGFDAVHHELQVRLERGGHAAHALDATLAMAPTLLAPFGVYEPGAVRLTALLYLIDLAARYLADRQAEAGARLGVLGSWLLPVLVRRLAEL